MIDAQRTRALSDGRGGYGGVSVLGLGSTRLDGLGAQRRGQSGRRASRISEGRRRIAWAGWEAAPVCLAAGVEMVDAQSTRAGSGAGVHGRRSGQSGVRASWVGEGGCWIALAVQEAAAVGLTAGVDGVHAPSLGAVALGSLSGDPFLVGESDGHQGGQGEDCRAIHCNERMTLSA